MVRPVGSSSCEATPSSVDDKKIFGEEFCAAAGKCARCALEALREGATAAFDTTVDWFKSDVIVVRLVLYGAVLVGLACILPVAMLASTSALPVIAAVGGTIAGVAMGGLIACVAMLIAIPILVGSMSIFTGGAAATEVILKELR